MAVQIVRPEPGLRVQSSTPIRLNGIEVRSGVIQIHDTAAPMEIASGTKGIVTGVDADRAWIELAVDAFGPKLRLSVDRLRFGSFFDAR